MDGQNKVFHEIIHHQNMTVDIVKYCTIYMICSWLRFTEVADLSVFIVLLGESVGWAWDDACVWRQAQGSWCGISVKGGGKTARSCSLGDRPALRRLCASRSSEPARQHRPRRDGSAWWREEAVGQGLLPSRSSPRPRDERYVSYRATQLFVLSCL